MRRMEILLDCDKKTIRRKITHLAQQARAAHAVHLATVKTAFVMTDER